MSDKELHESFYQSEAYKDTPNLPPLDKFHRAEIVRINEWLEQLYEEVRQNPSTNDTVQHTAEVIMCQLVEELNKTFETTGKFPWENNG